MNFLVLQLTLRSSGTRQKRRAPYLYVGGYMSDASHYPKDNEVKVEWKLLHIAIIVMSVLVIWPIFYYTTDSTKSFTNKLFSVAGLNIDIIGVVVASLKTPYYGLFVDGGKIEFTRANAEKKYFQVGMLLIALGFFFQALGTLL